MLSLGYNGLNDLIVDINNTCVQPQDILSAHAYYFNKNTGKITW